MRVGLIGDVHGHRRELIAMLGQLEAHGVDAIVSLGDAVDRGPASISCLRIMRDWGFTARDGERTSIQMIKGNHEDAYVRAHDRLPKPGRTAIEGPEERALSRCFDTADVEFMRDLPTSLHFPEINVTALHGGVTPHMDEIDEFSYRVRYLDARYYELRGTCSGDVFWAEVYDGRFGLICFGHESHAAPTLYENALALDGEGYRKLHGAVISDEPEDEWITCFTVRYDSEDVRRVNIAGKPHRVHDWLESWRSVTTDHLLTGRRWF